MLILLQLYYAKFLDCFVQKLSKEYLWGVGSAPMAREGLRVRYISLPTYAMVKEIPSLKEMNRGVSHLKTNFKHGYFQAMEIILFTRRLIPDFGQLLDVHKLYEYLAILSVIKSFADPAPVYMYK